MIIKYICDYAIFIRYITKCKHIAKIIQTTTKLDEIFSHILNIS